MIALPILGAVSMIAFLYFRDEKSSALATILKTLTSLFFIAVAVYGFAKINANRQIENLEYFCFILAGLVMGLVGDVTLDLKLAYPQDNDIYTYTGMSSFAIGHIFYLIALIMYWGFNGWAIGAAAVIAVIVISTSIFVMKFNFGKFLIPAIIYSFLLSYMTCQAFYAGIKDSFTTASILLLIGGILFLVSDAILSMSYFGGKNNRILIIANHVTYYAAQFLIAFSIYCM
jgi:uncharacterized membrane protein YhhN